MPTSRRTVMAAGNSNQSGTGWGSGNVSGGGGGGGDTNEPAGYTQVFSNPMASIPTTGSGDAYGFQRYDLYGNNLTIRTDNSGGESDPSYMRLTYPAGHPGGADAPTTWVAGRNFSGASLESPKTGLYVRTRARLDPIWTDNGNVGTKFFFFSQFTEGGQTNNHYVNLTGLGDLTFGVATQFNDNGTLNRNYLGLGPYAKNAFHVVELNAVANTVVPGVSEAEDGILKLWVDGVLEIDRADVLWFRRNQTACWRGLYANPTYGGGLNDVPADQWLDVEHWYVSTKA